MPYNPQAPVVCMDEKPYQLLGKKGNHCLCAPEIHKRWIPNISGTASAVSLYLQSRLGRPLCKCMGTADCNRLGRGNKIPGGCQLPAQSKIILVMDNLNTHAIASLYKTFPAKEAHRIARKLEIHFTPKHVSWLDISKIELNVMTRQCLSRRIEDIDKLRHELKALKADQLLSIL